MMMCHSSWCYSCWDWDWGSNVNCISDYHYNEHHLSLSPLKVIIMNFVCRSHLHLRPLDYCRNQTKHNRTKRNDTNRKGNVKEKANFHLWTKAIIKCRLITHTNSSQPASRCRLVEVIFSFWHECAAILRCNRWMLNLLFLFLPSFFFFNFVRNSKKPAK